MGVVAGAVPKAGVAAAGRVEAEADAEAEAEAGAEAEAEAGAEDGAEDGAGGGGGWDERLSSFSTSMISWAFWGLSS